MSHNVFPNTIFLVCDHFKMSLISRTHGHNVKASPPPKKNHITTKPLHVRQSANVTYVHSPCPPSPAHAIHSQMSVRFDLRGSGVCTELLTVSAYDPDLSDFSVVDRNDCPLDAKQGFADMAGVLLLFLLLFVLGKAQDKAAEFVDTQVPLLFCPNVVTSRFFLCSKWSFCFRSSVAS